MLSSLEGGLLLVAAGVVGLLMIGANAITIGFIILGLIIAIGGTIFESRAKRALASQGGNSLFQSNGGSSSKFYGKIGTLARKEVSGLRGLISSAKALEGKEKEEGFDGKVASVVSELDSVKANVVKSIQLEHAEDDDSAKDKARKVEKDLEDARSALENKEIGKAIDKLRSAQRKLKRYKKSAK